MLCALFESGQEQVERQQQKRHKYLHGCRLSVERTAVRHAAHSPLLMKELALERLSWDWAVLLGLKAREW